MLLVFQALQTQILKLKFIHRHWWKIPSAIVGNYRVLENF